MRNRFAGIATVFRHDDRLELRTWQRFQYRWYLDGEPVSKADRKAYLKAQRRAKAKSRRGNRQT